MKSITAGLLMAATAALCHGQTVISAHSGTVHYFEGDVSIDGAALVQKVSHFSEVKEQQTLRTGPGRAEILLTPGVFLRIGENSAIRMLDNRLASTRVEVVQGTVMVESMDQQMSLKDSPVTLIYGSYEVHMVKHGLVEIGTDPAGVKVFKGETEVVAGDNRAVVKEGRLVPLAAGLVTEKFDVKSADDLYLWARDRSESLSAANMASARRISSGYASGGASTSPWNGGWYFNSYMDMFTYVPAFGMMASPFGYGYFSPGAIYSYYSPMYSFYGAGPMRASGPVSGLVSPVRALASASAPGGGAQFGSPIRSGASAPGGGFSGGGRPSFGGGGGGGGMARSGGVGGRAR